MEMTRTQITLPNRLLRQIDALVGKSGRSAFITEITQCALRNRKDRLSLLEADLRDTRAAQKALKSPVRIPWKLAKQNRKSG